MAGDVNKNNTDAITRGKEQMVPGDLRTDEIKVLIEYINKSFKK